MNRIWRIKKARPELSHSLAGSLKISPILAQLLINRGITDEMQAHHFLYADFNSCHDPLLLKDMEKSVQRIKEALSGGEKILIYGDYDVDGITAVALLHKALTYLNANVTTYIPNRLEEGYGLNVNAVKLAHSKKITLIITVDCGISAHEEVKIANRFGIDVIITDHHEIKSVTSASPESSADEAGSSGSLPEAYSIINPHQKECRYPFKHLSGVGLAYKLAQVLLKDVPYPVEDRLDLVALGTVSDLSVQKGENRILTKLGLEKLNNTKSIGIKSLVEVSGLKGKDVSCRHIGYVLGPRINAMGRTGSPETALKLLLTDDDEEALRLAEILNRENRKRQKIENRVLDEAMEKVKREVNFKDSRVIVLYGTNWHVGVIGIVASRIVDKFYRPTIMIAVEGGVGKGSGRSIDNFHLFNAVNACKGHLIDFGGHEAACGLVIDKKNIRKFTDEINSVAKRVIVKEDLCPRLDIDVDIPLSKLTEKLVEELELLVPFGPENPQPVFSSRNVYLRNEPRRIAKSGFKMWVSDDRSTCEAVSFRSNGISVPAKGSKVDLAYFPSINTWQGLSSLQLDLKDLKMVL